MSNTSAGSAQARKRLWVAVGLGLLCAWGVLITLDPTTLSIAWAASPARPLNSGTVATCDEASLNAALAGGGTVTFSCNGVITLTSSTLITAPTTLDGAGQNVTLSGNNAVRIITTTAEVGVLTLRNITLTLGKATGGSFSENTGGALFARGALVLSNTTLMNNSATGNGGGAYVTGTLTLINAQFLSNTTSSDGGGAWVNDLAQLNGGLFQNNTATDNGGGLYAAGTLTLTDTHFLNNHGYNSGGGAWVNGTTLLNGGLFQSNASGISGAGGLYVSGTLRLTGTQFLSNTGGYGGGAYVLDAAQLNNALFQNNSAANFGGGLWADSTLALTDTRFISNAAPYRGGAFAGGAATLNGGLFQNNHATNSSGGFQAFSTLDMTGTQFLSNTANNSGGGVNVSGATNIMGGLFQNNVSTIGFGGGLNADSTLMLTGTQFISNSTGRRGGGAYVYGAAQVNGALFQDNRSTGTGIYDGGAGLAAQNSLQLTDTRFLSNTSVSHGGGLYLLFGPNAIYGGLFQNNLSTNGLGGGLYAYSALALTGTQFVSNTSNGHGGGAYANDVAKLNGALFQSNTVISTTSSGGGLYAASYSNLLTDTRFLSNTASADGGGVYLSKDAQVNGGQFQNNVSTNGNGGGLNSQNNLTLIGTQFISNTASANGGGLYGGYAAGYTFMVMGAQFLGNRGAQGGGLYHNDGDGRIVNALFARNVATSTLGAGLFLNSTGSVQVLHATIASPTVANGSAIYIGAGTVGITNTIVASYTIGISLTSGTVFENYNLFFGNGTDRVGVLSGTNSLNGNPVFVSPLTDDYHLTALSIAVNNGTNVGVSTDFEGQVRPQSGDFDIGYDESPFYAPIVGFSAANNSPKFVGQAVAFTVTVNASNNISYTWSFGDLSAGAGASPALTTTHPYAAIGAFTATVTATNALSVVVATMPVTIPARKVYLPLVVR